MNTCVGWFTSHHDQRLINPYFIENIFYEHASVRIKIECKQHLSSLIDDKGNFPHANINKSFYGHHKVWCSDDFNGYSCHKHQGELSLEELFRGNLFGTNKRINIPVMELFPEYLLFVIFFRPTQVWTSLHMFTRCSLGDYITLPNYIMKVLSASSWPIILLLSWLAGEEALCSFGARGWR